MLSSETLQLESHPAEKTGMARPVFGLMPFKIFPYTRCMYTRISILDSFLGPSPLHPHLATCRHKLKLRPHSPDSRTCPQFNVRCENRKIMLL